MIRFFTTLLIPVALTGGCDPPPDGFELPDTDSGAVTETGTGEAETETGTGEAETETGTGEAETETGSATDSDGPVLIEWGCLEGVLCMLETPEDSGACLEDLDPEAQAAATEVGLCLFVNCLDSTEAIGELMLCLLSNCTEETLACVAGGTGELSL